MERLAGKSLAPSRSCLFVEARCSRAGIGSETFVRGIIISQPQGLDREKLALALRTGIPAHHLGNFTSSSVLESGGEVLWLALEKDRHPRINQCLHHQ